MRSHPVSEFRLAAALLLIGLPLQAQLISVRSSFSSDSMMIGDQITYTLKVEAAGNVQFRLPEFGDTLGRQMEVLSPVSMDTVAVGERLQVEHSYLVTSFEPGTHMVPSFPVEYQLNDLTDTARSMPLMIQVFEPMVDTTQAIKAIKGPINTPLTLRELLPWIFAGLGVWMVGTLIAALVWMHRQRRKDPEIFSVRPREPAHVVAFRELDALRDQKLWESGQVKRFYTRLTEITRTYIERQYGIPAMERTSMEILEAFRRSNTEDPLLDEMLADLLQLADLVKFAREDPLPVENQTNLNNAYLFVQKTYPMFYMEGPEAQTESTPDDGSGAHALEVAASGAAVRETDTENRKEATDGKP